MVWRGSQPLQSKPAPTGRFYVSSINIKKMEYNIGNKSFLKGDNMANDDMKLLYTRYNSKEFVSREIEDIEGYISDHEDGVKWLDLTSLTDELLIWEIVKKLNLHKLVLKDIINVEQNPKLVDYEDYLLIIVKTTEFNNQELLTKQISFILLKDKLISFSESECNIFKDIYSTIENMSSLRKNGPDDLLYYLLDLIVDNYFTTIEKMGEEIDDLEDYLLGNPSKEFLNRVYSIKRQLIYMRTLLYHMRNVTGSLSKDEFDLIDGRTIYYLRDVNEQIIQIVDLVETYRDICSNMLDTYLSSIGNKTNEVMKVLTIFSSIFIPLTFLAGVYGMNFKYFPEINWKYGYAGFWVISIILIAFMIRFFRKKSWM